MKKYFHDKDGHSRRGARATDGTRPVDLVHQQETTAAITRRQGGKPHKRIMFQHVRCGPHVKHSSLDKTLSW